MAVGHYIYPLRIMCYYVIHPEGHNKIQDRYKLDMYVIVGHHSDLNVYYIQLLNKDKPGSQKVVNRHQLFDLNHGLNHLMWHQLPLTW